MYNILLRKAIVLAMPILFIGTCIVSGIDGNIQKNIGEDIDTKIINDIISTNSKIVSSSRDVDWWSMFRHDPEHIGHSTSKAPDTENILWSYTTSLDLKSSPAVADDKVYVGSDDYNIYCLDAGNGAKLWEYTTGNEVYSSPAVADGKVYVGSRDNCIYCLDMNNGNEIWRYETVYTVRSSPAVADGKVYVGSDDYNIYCLDAGNGSKLWEYTTGSSVRSSPAVADGKVYVGSRDNCIYCLDAGNGSKLWDYKTGASVYSSPAVADGNVYIGSWDDNIYCFGSGNKPPNANFTYNPLSPSSLEVVQFNDTSIDVDGYVESWHWDFGDGNTSTDQNSTHQYGDNGTYSVTLRITDNGGETDEVLKYVTVINVPPNANFIFSPDNPSIHDLIQFSDISFDPDGTIVSWHWDFGDGSGTSTDQNPTYSYNDNGTYDVTLSVTDNDGLTDTDTKKITIEGEGSTPVTVEITFPTQNGIVEGAVTVIGTATADDTIQKVEVKIDSGSWILANGTESWSYKWDTISVSNGDHTIHARSYDGNDYSNIDSVDITVDNPTSHANQAPIVTISYPGNMYTVYGTITLAGTASDNDGAIQNVQIRIDFGSWILANGTESWSYKWDTTDFVNGSYIIDVRSYDGEDYSPIAEITVTVRNIQGADNGEYSGGDGGKYADPDGPSDSTLILFIILVAIISTMGIVSIIYIIRIKTPT
jgi:outer membrane protein assembly factor BamB